MEAGKWRCVWCVLKSRKAIPQGLKPITSTTKYVGAKTPIPGAKGLCQKRNIGVDAARFTRIELWSYEADLKFGHYTS